MRTLNCLSDLKKYLDSKEVEVDCFDGISLSLKGKKIGFISVFDKWNVSDKDSHVSYTTKEFVKQIDNIIEE